jgi:hypothetical protein
LPRIPRRGFENNVKMYLQGIVCENVKWIHVIQDRVLQRTPVNALMNRRVLQKTGNLLTC